MTQKWYDVQDEEGTWRIGQLIDEDKDHQKIILMDGFHPNSTSTFCEHSEAVKPIRTHTFGLTLPEDGKILREVLTQLEIENVSARLNLYIMKPNYLELDPKLIRSSIRTQFLVLVHKIMSTPFQIIKQIKMMNLEVSKFFINILIFYARVIQSAKSFMSMIQTNQTAKQLYKSIYQLTLMANMIFGIDPFSQKLYDHKLNLNLKSTGFIDFFVMSDSGLLPFRNLFKSASQIKKPQKFDYELSKTLAIMFVQLCDKAKTHLVDGPHQSKTILVLDELINNLKHIAEQNQELKQKMSENLTLISKIQALYFKFRPNKSFPLRKILAKEQFKPEVSVYQVQSHQRQVSDEQFLKMGERIKKLQLLINSQQNNKAIPSFESLSSAKFQRPQLPIENLGEEMFLGSLEWALQTGDVASVKRLVKWRKSLLQVGRITGWQTALAIGLKTYNKKQITPDDIIQANYEYISKLSN